MRAGKKAWLFAQAALFPEKDFIWYPHRDSNTDLLLRTELFYPLNYGDPIIFYLFLADLGWV